MPDSIQEPKRLRIKNGTESGNWDETQLAPVFLAGVFAMITLVFIVNNRLVPIPMVCIFYGHGRLSYIYEQRKSEYAEMASILCVFIYPTWELQSCRKQNYIFRK